MPGLIAYIGTLCATVALLLCCAGASAQDMPYSLEIAKTADTMLPGHVVEFNAYV